MDAHLGGNSDEDQDICIILKCLPGDCSLTIKGGGSSYFIMENLDNTLTKSSKLTLLVRTETVS